MYIDADMTEMAQHERKHDFSASHSTRAALVTSLGTQPVTSNSNKYHLPLVSPSTSHGHQYTSTAPYKQRRSLAASFVLSCGRGALLQESSAPGVWCVSKLELLCVDALCGMGIESLCRPGNVVEFSDESIYYIRFRNGTDLSYIAVDKFFPSRYYNCSELDHRRSYERTNVNIY